MWDPSSDRSNTHPYTPVDERPADNCDEEIAYLNSNVKRSERSGKHYGRASLVKENTEHAATSQTSCTDIEDVGRTQVSQGGVFPRDVILVTAQTTTDFKAGYLFPSVS